MRWPASSTYWVYILASQRNGTLYIGVTNDIERRVWEHREELLKGFTSRYGVNKLVWYEGFGHIDDAITCEKRLKKWNRKWKLRLIEERNPDWKDLSETFTA
jgi:putative endonuclease